MKDFVFKAMLFRIETVIPRALVLIFIMVIVSSTIFSCRQVPDDGSGQSILPEADLAEIQPGDPTLLPPSPACGDLIGIDPPGFHWPQDKEDAGFILEISRSGSFPESNRLLKERNA